MELPKRRKMEPVLWEGQTDKDRGNQPIGKLIGQAAGSGLGRLGSRVTMGCPVSGDQFAG